MSLALVLVSPTRDSARRLQPARGGRATLTLSPDSDRVQPTSAGVYNAVGEAMTMYGLLGGSDDFHGLGAKEMYAHALALTPANTCAATHVAYQQRRTEAQAQAQAQAQCAEEADEAGLEEAGEEEAWEEKEAATLAELSVSADELRRGDGAARAVAIWRRHGVVLSPVLATALALLTLAPSHPCTLALSLALLTLALVTLARFYSLGCWRARRSTSCGSACAPRQLATRQPTTRL